MSPEQPGVPPEASPLFVSTFPVGVLQCNCTVIGNRQTGEAIVIDPGGDARKILDLLHAHQLTPSRIVHTHAHFDHILAAGELHDATGAPLALHPDDRWLWENLAVQCRMFQIPDQPLPLPHQWLKDEEVLELTGCCGHAIHTPGHTPGSTSFLFESANLLLAGDTLFKGSIGRTDLWGGDYSTLEHSIQTRLYSLNENLTVITGHGPSTTLQAEMHTNPYVTKV